MTLPSDVANIVYSFIPEACLALSFDDQKAIVREMTGCLPSDPGVVVRYLEDPRIEILVDDPRVYPLLQQQVAEDTGVMVDDLELLRLYLKHKDLAVLARDIQNWNLLEERSRWVRRSSLSLGECSCIAVVACRFQSRGFNHRAISVISRGVEVWGYRCTTVYPVRIVLWN
jgi:hypothetical protein